MPLAFTVGLLAENTEQDLNFGAGLRLLIIILLIPAGSVLTTRWQMTQCIICTCFWVKENSLARSLRPFSVLPQIAINWEWQLLKIIKGVCKCDIDLIQQFNKQEVNIKWLTLSEYNTTAWFCAMSSSKIVPNKETAERCTSLKANTAVFHSWMNCVFKRI